MRLCPESVSRIGGHMAASGVCWQIKSQQSQCFGARISGFRFRWGKTRESSSLSPRTNDYASLAKSPAGGHSQKSATVSKLWPTLPALALIASACDHECPPRPAYCEDEAYDLHQNAYAYCHRDAVGTIQGGRRLLCTCPRDQNGTVGR